MNNQANHLIDRINQIPSRKLREVIYILSSDDLPNSQIPLQLRYPPFEFDKQGKLGLEIDSSRLDPLIDELESLSDKTALGRYAERLLVIWFRHNPHFELLKHNHQIVIEKRTIGEIDFLLKERDTQRSIQLEFTLKYYLAFQESASDIKFIGPKGRDSLEAKSKKLIDQQMQLSLNHSEMLEEELRDLDFRPQIMMKGALFFPLLLAKKANYWLHINKLEEISGLGAGTEFVILKSRRDWLFPFDKALWHEKIKFDDCLSHLKRSTAELPIMIAYKSGKGDYGRLMIVAELWPKLNKF